MKRLVGIALLLVGAVSAVHADSISIFNEGDEAVYCAVYYKDGQEALRHAEPFKVSPGEPSSVQRPPYKWLKDRELICSPKNSLLLEELKQEQLRGLVSQNIGLMRGDLFHLARRLEDGLWQIYSKKDWKRSIGQVVQTTAGVALAPINLGLSTTTWAAQRAARAAVGVFCPKEGEHPAVLAQPAEYAESVAQVVLRAETALAPGEQKAEEQRMMLIQKKLERKLLKAGLLRSEQRLPLSRVPRVALVFSGGGYRAMARSLGALVGAEEEGLLDQILYMVGLSGSSWAIAPWVCSDTPSVSVYRDRLFDRIAGRGVVGEVGLAQKVKEWDASSAMDQLARGLTSQNAQWIAEAALLPVCLERPFSPVNLYGAFLANVILSPFEEKRQRVYFYSATEGLESGKMPLPICVAVQGADKVSHFDLEWVQFSPWATYYNKFWVPMWAFGRRFQEGKSIEMGPGISLGFMMGICGSAFAVTPDFLYDKIEGLLPPAAKAVLQLVAQITPANVMQNMAGVRFASALVANFTRGMKDSPIAEKRSIRLVDAGLAFNIAYPGIADRSPDIIIICDSSRATPGKQLYYVRDYARKRGVPFPDFDEQPGAQGVQLFKQEGMPVVIYLPMINDVQYFDRLSELPDYAEFVQNPDGSAWDMWKCAKSGVCGTFNFTYTREQFDQLSGASEFQMRVAADAIRKEIWAFATGQIAEEEGEIVEDEPLEEAVVVRDEEGNEFMLTPLKLEGPQYEIPLVPGWNPVSDIAPPA